MNWYKNKLFLQVITAFLVAVFIPLSVFGFLSFTKAKNDNLNAAINQYQQQLNLVARQLDAHLEAALQSRQTLIKSKYFYNFYLRRNPGAYTYIIPELNNLRYVLQLGNDITFYSRTTNAFYNGGYQLADIYFWQKGWSSAQSESLLDFLAGCTALSFWQPAGLQEVYLVIPFEESDQTVGMYYSHLLFPIPSSYYKEQLSGIRLSPSTQLLVSVQGTPVYGNAQAFSEPALPTQELLFSQGLGRVSISVRLPQTDLVSSGSDMLHQYFVYSLISVLVGSLLIILLVRRQYAPLAHLATAMEKVTGLTNQSRDNLFEQVSQSLLRLHQQNRDALLHKQRYQQKHLLLAILSGTLWNRQQENLEPQLAECGLLAPFPFFTCIVLEYAPGDADAAQLCMQPAQLPDAQVWCYTERGLDLCVYILSSPTNAPQASDLFVQKLRQLAQQFQQPFVCIGIGLRVQGLDQVALSYSTAQQALRYGVQGNRLMVQYHEIEKIQQDPRRALQSEISALCRGISQEDPSVIRLCGLHIHNGLLQLGDPETCRLICVDLCYRIRLALSHSPALSPYWESLADRTLQANGMSAAEYSDLADQMVKRCLLELKEGDFLATQPEKKLYTVDEISSYILDNITQEDFSVQSMADHFGMSASNISHFFKKRSGSTLSDFISETKLELVKRLLVETDSPVSDIAQKVGYYHTSNFIRMFKKDVGITPLEYRLEHHKA